MKDRIRMIVFIVVLGSAWALTLVGVDRATGDRITAYKRGKVRKSVLTALGIDYRNKSVDEVFKSNISEKKITIDGGEQTVYCTKDDARAFEFSASASQGPVVVVLAFEADMQTIRGMKTVASTETPGLGACVLADDNLAKLKGKKVVPKFVVTRAGEADADNEFDGVTGATLTSKALEKLVNEAAARYARVLGGG